MAWADNWLRHQPDSSVRPDHHMSADTAEVDALGYGREPTGSIHYGAEATAPGNILGGRALWAVDLTLN